MAHRKRSSSPNLEDPADSPTARTIRARIGDFAAVGAGGAIGTTLRALGMLALPTSPGGIPWAIATANLLGAFGLGALVVRLVRDHPGRVRLRLFLLTGLLGSFTTFSALAVDLVELSIVRTDGSAALLYLLVSVPGGILAAHAGLGTGNRGHAAVVGNEP